MPARRIGVVLLLAAVFCLHGLDCMAAHSAGGHGAGFAAGVPSPMGWPAAGEGIADHALPGSGHDAGPGPHGPLHGVEVWLVCVAVLLTGIGLLRAAAARRASAVLSVRGSPLRGRPLRPNRLPPPPELSALCLLRV